MENIIYILFQTSCIIFLILINKSTNSRNSLYESTKYFCENNLHSKPIIKNSLTNKVMIDLKKTILERKPSDIQLIESNIKENMWNNKYNFNDIIKKKKGLIIDLNTINFTNKQFIKNINFIEKKCFDNSVMLFIIGEEKRYEFINNLKYFNILNYISPFNYSKTWFSKPTKSEIGKINNIPCNVSINTMISDISNQYGILINHIGIINFNKNYNDMNYIAQHYIIE